VSPLFLFHGRHVEEDIPALVEIAASRHPGVDVVIAEPIGMNALVADALESQLNQALLSQEE